MPEKASQHQVEEVVRAVERSTPDVPHEEIERRAAAKLEQLADAPVQTFTPLLAQHQVIRDLKRGDSSEDVTPGE